MKVLDNIDANISHLIILGCDDVNLSMPVLHKNENGELCLAAFSWQARNKKQRNVPKPEHIILTTISGGNMVVTDVPKCGMPEICTARPMSAWTQKSLARDLDDVLDEYLATGKIETYMYMYYLENMLANYDACYYPLFKALNLPDMQIDVLRDTICIN